jgi:peptidoglycan/LPS O-acetylase OafA/YrhL
MEVNLHQRYNLNILRGLAILSLMILHAIALKKFNIQNSIIQILITRLHLGIPFFFLISGYLISLSWDGNLGVCKYHFKNLFYY